MANVKVLCAGSNVDMRVNKTNLTASFLLYGELQLFWSFSVSLVKKSISKRTEGNRSLTVGLTPLD